MSTSDCCSIFSLSLSLLLRNCWPQKYTLIEWNSDTPNRFACKTTMVSGKLEAFIGNHVEINYNYKTLNESENWIIRIWKNFCGFSVFAGFAWWNIYITCVSLFPDLEKCIYSAICIFAYYFGLIIFYHKKLLFYNICIFFSA